MNFIGKLLPIDGFRVSLTTNFPYNYQQALHHLYQPLIGVEAIHLYELLLEEAKLMDVLALEKQTHHTLMNQLNISLDVIYSARLKLEGIGLLQTFKEEMDMENTYTYELFPPFSPMDFFADFMLSELLERQVGTRRFEQLKTFYTRENRRAIGENITASFHEVFQTFKPTEGTVTRTEVPEKRASLKLLPVDFNLLASALKERDIPVPRVLTEENRRIISQLHQLYDLESYELEKALIWALTEEYTLDIEQFKAACHDFFTSKRPEAQVKLTEKRYEEQQPLQISAKQTGDPKLESLIKHLESITPKQLLEDLSLGNRASQQDLKMIRDIMVTQGIPTPVMNVLIHFTLLKTNMQLSKPYMEKIASHWSRAKLKTAREAVQFVLNQTSKQKETNKRPDQNKRRAKTEEVIPDWFKDRKMEKPPKEKKALTEEELKAEEEMAAILRKYHSH